MSPARGWPKGRPRRAFDHWTILCPGFSLATWDLRDLQGPVVAVTEALFADAPITHWCHPEGPLHWFQERCRSYGPRIIALGGVELWCGKGHRPKFDRWRVEEPKGYFVEVPWRVIRDDLTLRELAHLVAIPLPHHWTRDAFARGPTFVSVFRAMVAGAREIEIYGCDMEGRANWVGGTPRHNRRSDEWWMVRWKREQRLMRDLIGFCESRGVTLTLHPAKEQQAA